MALKQRNRLESQSGLVECTESFVAVNPDGGDYVCRLGTVWREDHPAVRAYSQWFVALGDGQTTPRYVPEPSS